MQGDRCAGECVLTGPVADAFLIGAFDFFRLGAEGFVTANRLEPGCGIPQPPGVQNPFPYRAQKRGAEALPLLERALAIVEAEGRQSEFRDHTCTESVNSRWFGPPQPFTRGSERKPKPEYEMVGIEPGI